MSSYAFRYQILRYIPDLLRMEPRNVGVIVQSNDAIKHRINGYFRTDSNGGGPDSRSNFRDWRLWFKREITAKRSNDLVPTITSPGFLDYLRSRCTGNYQLTEQLALVWSTEDIGAACDYLFRTVVLPPAEKETDVPRTPVRCFRHAVQELRLDEFTDLLVADTHVAIGGLTVWADLHHRNGYDVITNTVQAVPQVSQVQHALDAACYNLDLLAEARRVTTVVIVDPLRELLGRGQEAPGRRTAFVERIKHIKARATTFIDTPEHAYSYARQVRSVLLEHQSRDAT